MTHGFYMKGYESFLLKLLMLLLWMQDITGNEELTCFTLAPMTHVNIGCPAGSKILVTSAIYGASPFGLCYGTGKDCTQEVPLPMRCCGRKSCTFDVRNRYLTKCMQPATYYQVYFMCVKGEMECQDTDVTEDLPLKEIDESQVNNERGPSTKLYMLSRKEDNVTAVTTRPALQEETKSTTFPGLNLLLSPEKKDETQNRIGTRNGDVHNSIHKDRGEGARHSHRWRHKVNNMNQVHHSPTMIPPETIATNKDKARMDRVPVRNPRLQERNPPQHRSPSNPYSRHRNQPRHRSQLRPNLLPYTTTPKMNRLHLGMIASSYTPQESPKLRPPPSKVSSPQTKRVITHHVSSSQNRLQPPPKKQPNGNSDPTSNSREPPRRIKSRQYSVNNRRTLPKSVVQPVNTKHREHVKSSNYNIERNRIPPRPQRTSVKTNKKKGNTKASSSKVNKHNDGHNSIVETRKQIARTKAGRVPSRRQSNRERKQERAVSPQEKSTDASKRTYNTNDIAPAAKPKLHNGDQSSSAKEQDDRATMNGNTKRRPSGTSHREKQAHTAIPEIQSEQPATNKPTAEPTTAKPTTLSSSPSTTSSSSVAPTSPTTSSTTTSTTSTTTSTTTTRMPRPKANGKTRQTHLIRNSRPRPTKEASIIRFQRPPTGGNSNPSKIHRGSEDQNNTPAPRDFKNMFVKNNIHHGRKYSGRRIPAQDETRSKTPFATRPAVLFTPKPTTMIPSKRREGRHDKISNWMRTVRPTYRPRVQATELASTQATTPKPTATKHNGRIPKKNSVVPKLYRPRQTDKVERSKTNTSTNTAPVNTSSVKKITGHTTKKNDSAYDILLQEEKITTRFTDISISLGTLLTIAGGEALIFLVLLVILGLYLKRFDREKSGSPTPNNLSISASLKRLRKHYKRKSQEAAGYRFGTVPVAGTHLNLSRKAVPGWRQINSEEGPATKNQNFKYPHRKGEVNTVCDKVQAEINATQPVCNRPKPYVYEEACTAFNVPSVDGRKSACPSEGRRYAAVIGELSETISKVQAHENKDDEEEEEDSMYAASPDDAYTDESSYDSNTITYENLDSHSTQQRPEENAQSHNNMSEKLKAFAENELEKIDEQIHILLHGLHGSSEGIESNV